MLVLVTGGARSGKSRFAEQYTACLGSRGYYLATCRVWDEEMAERIALHQGQRVNTGFPWVTREIPLGLAEVIKELTEVESGQAQSRQQPGSPVILVDCMTLWLTNVVFSLGEVDWSSREIQDRAGSLAQQELQHLMDSLKQCPVPIVLVTNEVGDGLVPDYPLGRLFRDLAGRMNQQLAAISDEVFLVTAGIPVELKRLAFQLPAPYLRDGSRSREGQA